MAKVQVSVVMPVYNAQLTLERSVGSIQAQTLQAWELIVVDDGSTDQSLNWLKQRAAQDARICVLSRAHEGIVAALNAGLHAAQAPLIARMDADDWSHPERLERQVAYLNAHRDCGGVSCQIAHIAEDEQQSGYAHYVAWLNSIDTAQLIQARRFIESPLCHPSMCFRRSLIDDYGDYRAGDFPEDYELWLRWLDQGVQLHKLPQTLLHWHDLPARLSRSDARYREAVFYACKSRYLARELRRRLNGRGLWCWGASRRARRKLEHLLSHGFAPAGYIDIRSSQRENSPLKVIAPGELPGPEQAFVLSYVARRGAREQIQAYLEQRGYREVRDYLLNA